MHFALKDGRKILTEKKYAIDPFGSFQALEKLEDFFKFSKIGATGKGVTKIVTRADKGSFSGTRFGVTVAQALAMGWGVDLKIER